MGGYWTQLFPPPPGFTESELPSQKDKVFIVTGGASGVGFELVSILYRAGATVYIAGRSEQNALQAIDAIQKSSTQRIGRLEYLPLHLDDLETIKASAEDFKSRETKLDVLWNNAGVAVPPRGSTSKQGHELQLGTNCLGPYLFTRLLIPELLEAAKSSPAESVRVVWTSSMLVDTMAPSNSLESSELSSPQSNNQEKNYAVSKVGNWFLASEFARRFSHAGIVSITQNPGNLQTPLWRYTNKWVLWLVSGLLHEAKLGAYTELWAGLSPEVTIKDNGGYGIPWGRWHTAPRSDLLLALKSHEDGGDDRAAGFWDWCDTQTKDYM